MAQYREQRAKYLKISVEMMRSAVQPQSSFDCALRFEIQRTWDDAPLYNRIDNCIFYYLK